MRRLGSLPSVEVPAPDPEPDLWAVAAVLWTMEDLDAEDDSQR
jgi:hypothetical protein